MQEPLEIVFHNVQPSAALEADIRQRFAKLAKLYDRLTTCRVSVEGQHKQHRTGNIFEVHIDMLVPGGEIVVSKQPQKARERFANPDVYVSVREAFKAAERQLLEYKRQLSGEVKPQAALLHGQVAEMHADEDYGYLMTAQGSLLYFHRNAMLNGDFDKLQRGSTVHYTPGDGDSGPTAVKVWQGAEPDASRT